MDSSSINESLAMSKRLVLVCPPHPGLMEGFAGGLLALSAYVSRLLPEALVETLDCSRLSREATRQAIVSALEETRDNQLFIGITTTTASYQQALRVARICRGLCPNAKIVFGGPHASVQDDVILAEHPDIVDYVIRGEGEVGLETLIRNYPALGEVPNLSYRRSGMVVKNPPARFLSREALDLTPSVVYSQSSIEAPSKFKRAIYLSARGCHLSCAFCAVGGQKIRNKSIDAIQSDIRALVGKGYRDLSIEDNFFAHSRRRTRELCEGLADLREQENLSFGWDCQTRVESISPEIADLLARAGCEAVYLGVEALAKEPLRYLGKTRRPLRYVSHLMRTAIPSLLDAGVSVYLNLQLGVPGESSHDRSRTLKILRILGSIAAGKGQEITVFPQLHVVYPGTLHFEQAKAEKRFGPDTSRVFEEFTAWESKQLPTLKWLGYHFAHGTGGLPEGILDREFLQRGEFVIDPDAVLEVGTMLTDMDTLPGVSVFRYSEYLVTSEEIDTAESLITEAPPSASSA